MCLCGIHSITRRSTILIPKSFPNIFNYVKCAGKKVTWWWLIPPLCYIRHRRVKLKLKCTFLKKFKYYELYIYIYWNPNLFLTQRLQTLLYHVVNLQRQSRAISDTNQSTSWTSTVGDVKIGRNSHHQLEMKTGKRAVLWYELANIQIRASKTETYGIQIIIKVSRDPQRNVLFRPI